MDQMIRTMHPYGFRCGRWAKLIRTVPARGRDCYLVEFDDGKTDLWVVDDPAAEYEIAPVAASPGRGADLNEE